MKNLLLGLDYGTGGAKATIINTNGEEMSYAFEEYPILTPQPGWSEHDANLHWEVACRLIKSCIKEAKINPSEIAGIAVSSAYPSIVLVDKNIKPVHNAYNLMDKRAVKQVEWLRENIGEKKIFDISKNRLEDHPVITNLMWEKENRSEAFKTIDKALSVDGFINAKLTNKLTGHFSGAGFYGVAYNLLEKKFDLELLDEIGISPNLFPDLYNCEDIIGTVTSEAATVTGLSVGSPGAAGQVDCNGPDIQSHIQPCSSLLASVI